MAETSLTAPVEIDQKVVWDNHACLPLRPDDERFLPALSRYRDAGVNVVGLNITMDWCAPQTGLLMLAAFRNWISRHSDMFMVANSVSDIQLAKQTNRVAIFFDIEGGGAVAEHIGLVECYYRLGVRWMLIAYNRNNRLGGGCQENDPGLSKYGRVVIDEMERVGMVLCCSHTGYKTAREAMEYSRKPVIFSHSNPRGLWDHERNIPDDLMVRCAKTGGVININGIGIFLGENDNSTPTIVRHIDYAVQLVGSEHVGLGLDYVFDTGELDDFIRENPASFPPEKGYQAGIATVEPERIPEIANALLKLGYSELDVQRVMGSNNLRVARAVWK